MVEVSKDFIGDTNVRSRVLSHFRGKSNLRYCERNNKKLKRCVTNKVIIK